MNRIYLDHAATTPTDPRVIEVMLPYFNQTFANPSSIHNLGQQAEKAVETARASLAAMISCKPDEILFTSCGSESDNLALRGSALAAREHQGANQILISPVEHDAIHNTATQLQDLFGFDVKFLPTDEFGRVNPKDVSSRINENTAVISIIHASNEIGTINPITEIGSMCQEREVSFHSDAVQSAAHYPLDVQSLNVDMLSIGAHKFYGPKGIGALYVRRGSKIFPSQTGGSQEFGLRAGTENVPYIIGMVEALRLTRNEHKERYDRLNNLRNHIIDRILESIPDTLLTGHPRERLPNHASFAFKDVDANTLIMFLDMEGYACSSGSACKTGKPEPSATLIQLGLPSNWAMGSLRVTLGKDTTPEEIDSFLSLLPKVVDKVRNLEKMAI